MEYLPKHDLHIKLNTVNNNHPFRVSDCSDLTIKVFTSSRKHNLKLGFDDVEEKEEFDVLVVPAIMLKTLKSGVIQYEVEYQKKGNESCWFSFTVVTEIYLKNPYYKQTEEEIENNSSSIIENVVEMFEQYKGEITDDIDSKLDTEIYEREKQTFLTEQSLIGYATEKSVDEVKGQLTLKADKSELNNFVTITQCGLQAQQSEENAKKYTDSKVENLVKLWNGTKDDYDSMDPKDFQTVYVVDADTSIIVYLGDILLGIKNKPILRGKFTDDSTSSDWWYCADGSSSNKVNITEYVNPDTKEFMVQIGETGKLKTLDKLFYGNKKIEKIFELPIDENVTSLQSTFYNCSALAEIKGAEKWNVENVVNMSYMFYSCSKLETLDVSNWNIGKVTDMSSIFNGCSVIQTLDVSKWNVENVTNMYYMFQNCSKLETLDVSKWNVEKVYQMTRMFHNCKALSEIKGIENWNVHNVKYMNNMFYYCSALETINLSDWNVENVTEMKYLFSYCRIFQTLDLSDWNVAKVTDMSFMFHYCSALETLNLSNWNLEKVTNLSNIFDYCTQLQTIIGPIYNIKADLDMSSCSNLSKESVLVLLNGLADVGTTKTITFNSAITLTESEATIGTIKGWTISGAQIVPD